VSEALRLGVIGCGLRARVYCDGAAEVPGLRLTAYADLRPDAARGFLDSYGGDYACDDPGRVLADPSVDAVLICTWHDTHTSLAVEAARRGKHILIEKPLALTIDECWEIEEATRRAGVTVCTGLKMRFMPLVRRARAMVPRPIVLTGQMMNDRVPDTAWSLQPGIGGGTIIGAGCHTADLLCYLAGADPVEVYAAGSNAIHGGPAGLDALVGVIRFANGAVASLVHGDPGRNPYTSTFFCQVFGLGQGICLHERYRQATLWGFEAATLGVGDLDARERADLEGDVALLRHFSDCARAGRPSEAGAREGRIATTIMVKMLASAAAGRPQQVEVDWRSRYG